MWQLRLAWAALRGKETEVRTGVQVERIRAVTCDSEWRDYVGRKGCQNTAEYCFSLVTLAIKREANDHFHCCSACLEAAKRKRA